jgi:hypothetical protein
MLIGKWTSVDGAWEFTADGQIKRPFYSFTSQYKVLAGRTIEMTNWEGKAELELCCFKDTLCLRPVEVQGLGGKRMASNTCLMLQRVGDRDDEPIAGNPKQLLLGKWQMTWDHDWMATTWEFKAGDTCVFKLRTSMSRRTGAYRWIDDATLELPINGGETTNAIVRVVFARNKMALVYTLPQRGGAATFEKAIVYRKRLAPPGILGSTLRGQRCHAGIFETNLSPQESDFLLKLVILCLETNACVAAIGRPTPSADRGVLGQGHHVQQG